MIMKRISLALMVLAVVAAEAKADVRPPTLLESYDMVDLGMIIAAIAFVVALVLFGVWLARKWGSTKVGEGPNAPFDPDRQDRNVTEER
jgi:hypothetical protein